MMFEILEPCRVLRLGTLSKKKYKIKKYIIKQTKIMIKIKIKIKKRKKRANKKKIEYIKRKLFFVYKSYIKWYEEEINN